MNGAVPLPRPVLGIGVTGHRPERLSDCDPARLAAAIGSALDAIAAAAPSAAPRMISAVAEGADSIVADAALAHGWRLDVVLPFPREAYELDFAEGPVRDVHVARLAGATAIFELPGDRDGEDGSATAYERAGRLVLAQSDVLLAIWDSRPARGRGGAAQVVAEAVAQGLPVIHIDPAGRHPPRLLWSGLDEVDLGQQNVDTVARHGLERLPALFHDLIDPPADAGDQAMIGRFQSGRIGWRVGAIAYPLLLGVMGVRRPRRADLGLGPVTGPARSDIAACAGAAGFATRIDEMLAPRFLRADAVATRVARLFRSGYVTNFTLAAMAVLLSMLSLALPATAKPALIVAELVVIAIILLVTHTGKHAGWHRLWLDNRAVAERLRCLALSAQLGDLDLRGAGEHRAPWVAWLTRATAREIGLPHASADAGYLDCVRAELLSLIDGQTRYLAGEARRMHRLDHRLHLTGTILFALTALACLVLLVVKTAYSLSPWLTTVQASVTVGVTIVSAAFPAIGAAIYGIRMQGDFAGVADRSENLHRDLTTLHHVVEADDSDFDTLRRRVRRVADLLAGDLGRWLQTYNARPLALPG